MWRYMLLSLLLSVAMAPTSMSQQAPKFNYTTEAGIDSEGNIYVASEDGKPLKMATVAHCIGARFADDRHHPRPQLGRQLGTHLQFELAAADAVLSHQGL